MTNGKEVNFHFEKKYRLRKTRAIITLLMITAIILGIINLEKFTFFSNQNIGNDKHYSVESSIQDSKISKPMEIEKAHASLGTQGGISKANLLATGDIFFHQPMLDAAYREATGSFDFSNYFRYVKKYIEKADLAIINFEGTMAEGIYPLGGYPLFNAPMDAVTMIEESGFDVLSTANNHCLDSKAEGIVSTIDAIESVGMKHFGTNKTENAPILIEEVNGIKIAFLAYAYGFNGNEVTITDEEYSYMVNPLDESKIKADIKQARKDGADIVLIYAHWGTEYERASNAEQQELARKMVEWGGDLILGSHPHVLQETEWLERDGEKKFVIYSMGNTMSGQRQSSSGNKYTESGVLLDIGLEKDYSTGITRIVNIKTLPTWINNYEDGAQVYYELYVTEDFIMGGKYRDMVSEYTLARILEARDEAYAALNKELPEDLIVTYINADEEENENTEQDDEINEE